MNDFKKYYLMRVFLSTAFGVGLGVLLLVLRPYAGEVFDILVISLGLMTVVMNIYPFAVSLRCIKQKGEWINLTIAALAILLGVALMLLQKEFLLLLLGIYSVILPLVRILLVSEKRKQIRRELPKIFVGLATLAVFVTESEDIVFLAGAIVCFAVSALYLIYCLLALHFRYTERKTK